MKGLMKCLVLCVLVTAALVQQAGAEEFMVNGKPMNLFFYITQGLGYGLHNDYDTKENVQSAITNLFVEGDYALANRLKFYASGMFTADWAYDLNSHSKAWNDRLFDRSRKFLYMDNEYWQMLKEAHITWTPPNFMFRAGKQIVAWGETDGFRLMDQINPIDESRGFADVEFENTIIPIWLLRAEYSPKIESTWLQELGFQFIFNPNVTFIPNKQILAGNNEGGIWAPNLTYRDPTAPFGEFRIGSIPTNLDKPKAFSSKGFEYGFRIRGLIWDSVVTLNYFYGRDNVYVSWANGRPPLVSMASDGRLIIYPFFDGKYALLRFVGGTFSRDVPFLASTALGGVAPVVRMEGFYAFDSTFSNVLSMSYNKSDEIRWSLGVDWKIKIPLLNDKAMFSVSPQVYLRHIVDHPHGYNLGDLGDIEKNNWQTTLFVSTVYLNAKLTPSFFWLRDHTNQADMFRPQITYDYSDNWRYTLGAMFLDGAKRTKSFNVFENKDYIFGKISYKWG